MGRRGLQVILAIIGVVAVTAGGLTVLLGADSLIGAGAASPTIDSELRFYAAWYVIAGALLLRSVRRVESEAVIIRAVCAGLFLGGSGRLVSLIAVGTPHPVAMVLMGLEFAIPLVIVPWQAAVARRTS